MSLLSKLRNALTGNWATVTVDCPDELVRGQPASIKVHVAVNEEPVKVNRVYACVRAFEAVDIPDYEPNLDSLTDIGRMSVDTRDKTFDQEFILAQDQALDARSSHTFEGEIILPTDEQPTFNGRHARHEWLIFVGLDMPGNDPDSGWHVINVK